jgi:hypothetical protein
MRLAGERFEVFLQKRTANVPGFWEGVWSAFDLAAGGFFCNLPATDPWAALQQALRSDWEAVSQDFVQALQKGGQGRERLSQSLAVNRKTA